MKTKKEHLTAYSDGTYRQFLGCSNILQAMEDYAKQQVSGYIRALKSVKGCDTKKYRRCFLWPFVLKITKIEKPNEKKRN
jgi:hypothetical protein